MGETSLKQVVPHVVEAEVQGYHGVNPPVKDIVRTVRKWLHRYYPRPSFQIVWKLQIECRRVPVARNYYGVGIIQISQRLPNVLEIRVRPYGSQHQWFCHLYSTKEIVCMLCSLVRPSAYRYFVRFSEREEDFLDNVRVAPSRALAERQYQRAQVSAAHDNRVLKPLEKGQLRAELILVIQEVSMPSGIITPETVRISASRVLKTKISDQALRYLVRNLVGTWLLVPIDDNADNEFRASEEFYQQIEDHKERIRQQRIEELRRRIESNVKLKDAALREEQRALVKAQEQRQTADRLVQEISVLENEIKSLNPEE